MKIRNGNLSIPIPSLVKGGDDITAKWANSIRRALERLRDREPVLLQEKNINETDIFQPSIRRVTSAEPGGSGDAQYEINISEGYVFEIKSDIVNEGDEKIVLPFLVDGIYYEEDGFIGELYPELADMDMLVWYPIKNKSVVYIYFKTDVHGSISGSPEVRVGEPEEGEPVVIKGRPYKPPVGDFAGEEGEYYYPICNIIIRGETVYVDNVGVGNHIYHIHERPEMKNLYGEDEVGESYDVLKTYEKEGDQVQFRTLLQNDGDGAAVIEGSDASHIKFRRIKGLGSPDGQIDVTEEGNAILVRGNGVDGSLVWKNCDDVPTVLLEWKDGLIITGGAIEFKAGCKGTGTPTGTPP